MGILSPWGFILYFSIPFSLTFLALLFFVSPTSSNRFHRGLFECLNFFLMGKWNFLPLPLVHFIVAGHFIMLALLALKVWNDSTQLPPLSSAPLDRHLSFQSKSFRLQRNLYLTALAFVCWWMLAAVYSLKKQIRDLALGYKVDHAAEKSKGGDYSGVGPVQLPEPSAPPLENQGKKQK
jgi:hypothetical protein